MAAKRRRRSQWALLLAFPALIVVQSALGWQLEWAKPEQLDSAFGARLKLLRRQMASRPDNPLLLMMGSSRSMTGFCPVLWNDRPYVAFNFAQEGTGPVKNLIYLRRLLAEGIRPDYLLLDVTLPALAEHRAVPWENRWIDGALVFQDERATVEHYLTRHWKAVGQYHASRWLPSWQHNRLLASCLSLSRLTGATCFDDAPGIDPWGYRPLFLEVSPAQREQQTTLAMNQYAFLREQEQVSAPAVQALKDLIELCRQEKIRVALVVMPEGTQFRQLYTSAFLHDFDRVMTELGSAQAPLLDARTWIPDEEFYDQHHMLPPGAVRFTRRLETALKDFLPAS